MFKKNKLLIYFFTGKRGGFNHYIPILRLLKKNKIKFKILATDMHLSKFFGSTIQEIKKYSNEIITLKNKPIKDSVKNRLSVITNTINNMSKQIIKKRPSHLFVLGDRAEVLGAAIAALHHNVPIIHLYGGDVTQGGTDEPTRHALTKLSNLHLTSNIKSYKNVIKMGEENWRVHNVGLVSLDLFKKNFFKSRKYLEKKYKINFEKPYIILIQHPVTWQISDSKKQINETLRSILKFKIQTIAIYPCSDPGHKNIVDALKRFSKNNKYFNLYKNIEAEDFYSLLKNCKFLIGNSSCGITEAAFFKKNVINIGIRQMNRFSGKNVINVKHNSSEISKIIKKLLIKKKENISKKNFIYGNGFSAKKILQILKKINYKDDLIKKKFIE